jgi:putative membrane protein
MKERSLYIIIAVVAVASILFGGWGMGSHMWGPGFMTGWGGMGLGMGFFWVIVIIGLFLLFNGGRIGVRTDDRARAIARERYARGEITKEEFDEITKNL